MEKSKLLEVKCFNKSKNSMPEYGKVTNSGMDVRADIVKKIVLKPFQRVLVPTGLYFELPEDIEIQVRPRSGLAIKNGITVLNTPGTVDEGYRGEVCVILINLGQEDFTISPGDRIAQLVFMKVEKVNLVSVDSISEDTDRGSTGFGDSGIK